MKFSFCLSAILIIFVSACNRRTSNIPYYPVNLTIYLDDPQWIGLNAVGGNVQISGGSKGIILFRSSPDDILAFERHCPYQPEENCRLFIDSSFVTMSCSECCGSTFSLFDGNVINGPAVLPPLMYRTEIVNNVLYITN